MLRELLIHMPEIQAVSHGGHVMHGIINDPPFLQVSLVATSSRDGFAKLGAFSSKPLSNA
jgi:hypothetical protein